jgi:hypothetical protein
MAKDVPVEKRFRVLSEINRASHFAWRQAVSRRCPEIDPRRLVLDMWDITGVQTGKAYVKHVDPSLPLAPQIAASVAWSSQCMGEDAQAEPGPQPDQAFVRHRACPWHRRHRDNGLLEEDRPGCDRWLEATVRTINEELGSTLRFETLATLPDGDDCCLRRFWVEPSNA